jgi:glycosyltransferase involved in cell wall biosynthesis
MGRDRIKLCILIPTHWEALMGGAQYQAKILIEHLVRLGTFDIHYVAQQVANSYVPQGYSIHRVEGGRRIVGTFVWDVPRLWRLLRSLNPDVIYQRVGCAYTGVAARYGQVFGRRVVWHVASDRNLSPNRLQWSLKAPLQVLERSALEYGIRNATDIVVQTRDQDQLLRRSYGRGASAIIPNFYHDASEPGPKPEWPITVCWVANLKSLKRPEVFVQLAKDCLNVTSARFVMIGAPGQHASDLYEQMSGLANFQYLGYQPQERVNEVLSKAHLLVNTSEFEGFSNTFIQSWIREVPVLSLLVNPDKVFDTQGLGVCADGSYEKLLSALIDLINDPEKIRRMGAAARNYALEYHGEKNISALISLLCPLNNDANPDEQRRRGK